MFGNSFKPWTLISSASISLVHGLLIKHVMTKRCHKKVETLVLLRQVSSSGLGVKMLEVADITAWINVII